jgi:hypothetical protein
VLFDAEYDIAAWLGFTLIHPLIRHDRLLCPSTFLDRVCQRVEESACLFDLM